MTSYLEAAPTTRLRDELATIGVVPTPSKLFPAAPGSVARPEVVARVRARGADVVTITAPAGFGKSSLAAEIAAADDRPVAWLTLSDEDNDPGVMLTGIAFALDAVEPVDAGSVGPLWAGSPSIGSPAVRRFAAMFAARGCSFVLVLDDVHRLTDRDAVDALSALIAELPSGSAVVLASRTALPLPLGRLRAQRPVVELGPGDLAFGEDEATVLLDALGLALTPTERSRLVERTEGWPVALHLAALASAARGSGVLDDFGGDHRFLVDYLGEELLDTLDPDVATFLLDASCLDTMSGSACDAVLQRQGSARLLDDVHRRLLLVIPLDDHREAYRFHHLLADFLQSELVRRDPARRADIHRRASGWCCQHGDADGAVTHALRSGDYDLAETMVLRWWGTAAAAAEHARPSPDRWIRSFPRHELERRPLLMVDAAWGRFASGDGDAALRWLARAEVALVTTPGPTMSGLIAPVAFVAARSIMAPLDPAAMAADGAFVYARVGHGEGHPLSCLALGAAAFMTGDEATARRWLREGADTVLERPLVVANCLAHLAVIEVEHARWSAAAALADRARTLVGATDHFAHSALVLALRVLVATRDGDAAEADRQLCRRHLTGLGRTAPWLRMQAHLALGRAALLRGDGVEAAAHVDDVLAILTGLGTATGVRAQATALRRHIAGAAAALGPAALTTAELRVLRLLPTHLTIPEIAERLYVSRNTVKSQTIAIYRKLGTSSRDGAVRAAIVAGLLSPAPGQLT